MEAANILDWTFVAEAPIPQDVTELLVPGEVIYAAYKTVRDYAIFTSKRLIVRDAQGITRKKLKSIPCPTAQ